MPRKIPKRGNRVSRPGEARAVAPGSALRLELAVGTQGFGANVRHLFDELSAEAIDDDIHFASRNGDELFAQLIEVLGKAAHEAEHMSRSREIWLAKMDAIGARIDRLNAENAASLKNLSN